jgi:hypothetical protein
MKTWFIAFYRYKDTKTWQRTFLFDNKEKLDLQLKAMDYIESDYITKEIELPE